MKKCLIIRIAAYGDAICVTPILPLLKQDGYHITFSTSERGKEVLLNNPYIDIFHDHDEDIPANDELTRYWKELSIGYDRVINLTESIEGSISKAENRADFNWPKEKRHAECNVNFYDRTLELAGYPDIKGRNGELYFSDEEHIIAKNFKRKHNDKFVIVWGLSGSAFHKTYPYAEYVAEAFFKNHKDVLFVTVGDNLCRILEFNLPNTYKTCGHWSMRRSMAMTKYADLVIGTDTGLMHAAGCYDTPKILLLSANTEENLSKYWKNCMNLSANVPCQPCHRLVKSLGACPTDNNNLILGHYPVCMSKLDAKIVLNAIEEVYYKWQSRHNQHFH